jgi:hypothetical protein
MKALGGTHLLVSPKTTKRESMNACTTEITGGIKQIFLGLVLELIQKSTQIDLVILRV